MKTPLVDPPLAGSEKELVLGYTAFQQDVFLRKLQATDGSWLAEDALSRELPPSSMTLKGMAAHLWFVEDYWRDYILLGNPEIEPWASTDWDVDPDADWHSSLPLETIIEELKLSTNKTRQLLQGTDWDDVSKRANGEGNRFSYRWVALHLIEEWGRHLGHADLLRENIDGETGD